MVRDVEFVAHGWSAEAADINAILMPVSSTGTATQDRAAAARPRPTSAAMSPMLASGLQDQLDVASRVGAQVTAAGGVGRGPHL